MSDLDRVLRELAGDLEHPPTPGLADAVARRLRAERPRRAIRTRRLVIALAVALLVPAAAVAAVRPVRDAVLELLGIKGVQIVRTSTLPPIHPGRPQGLGRRVALVQALSLVDFPAVTPHVAQLGAPDEVYYRALPAGGAISLVYRARAGSSRSAFTQDRLLLTEFRGAQAPLFVRKFVGPGTSVRRVRVHGGAGVWLYGRPHEFAYVDAHGETQVETLQLAGNTLLWERGPLTLRLEGAVSPAAALRIARSLD
jgi:hypothetical protein